MKRTIPQFLSLLVCILCFSHCAKKGSPTGGPKDSIPPLILKSNPANFTTDFSEDEIRIYFDEYIKLVDLQQNLIISPPLDYQPIITPATTSKVLKIKILDTLKENTTYAFNFGKSIADNNEGNEFEYYKYVFSTGNYIDSLSLKGAVNDLLLPLQEKKITVMLYEWDESFKDSIIYTDKPIYIASTKVKDSSFELTNLKEGTYRLMALQEEVSNYTFEPSKDKIAFLSQPITLPTDRSFTLHLFKEVPDYKMTRPSHVSKHKIAFGYEGSIDSLQIDPMFPFPDGFEYKLLKDPKSDSLNFWFKPAFDLSVIDTLPFEARNREQRDTLYVKLRDLFADSLQIKMVDGSTLIPRDSIKLQMNTPLVHVQADKVLVMDKDSLIITPEVYRNELLNQAIIQFPKKDEMSYNVTILPEAFTDFFDNTNDTLKYSYRTKALSDYGTLKFTLQGLKEFPVIVELVDSSLKVVASEYLVDNESVYFDYINPGKYYLRVVYDTNKNRLWDTGNYLEKRQPEHIIYYPTVIEIRSNWSLNENFILE